MINKLTSYPINLPMSIAKRVGDGSNLARLIALDVKWAREQLPNTDLSDDAFLTAMHQVIYERVDLQDETRFRSRDFLKQRDKKRIFGFQILEGDQLPN